MNTGSFLERIYRLMNLYQAAQKQPRQYGSDLTLHAAEVHMLEVIGEFPGITSTELAVRLAVSKGAVSQTLRRLTEKGLILRSAVSDGRIAELSLSAGGEHIWQAHHALHAPLLLELEQLTSQFTPETLRALTQLEDVVERHLNQITQED